MIDEKKNTKARPGDQRSGQGATQSSLSLPTSPSIHGPPPNLCVFTEMDLCRGGPGHTHTPPLNYHKLLQAFYLIHSQPEKKLRFSKLGHSKTQNISS